MQGASEKMQGAVHRMQRTSWDCVNLQPVPPLEGLSRQHIAQAMRISRSNSGAFFCEGKYFVGRLCANALSSGTTVFTALGPEEPGQEHKGVVLVVKNAATRTTDLSALFPNGALALVKEPTVMRQSMTPVLLVQCPAAVEFFDIPREQQVQVEHVSAASLRTRGSEHFKVGALILAGQAYTESMNAALATSCSNGGGNEFVLAASNRAEVFLRLRRYEDALVDCNRALAVDGKHAKSCYRKGMACVALKEYKQAQECFQRAMELYTNKEGQEMARQEWKRCCNLVLQSETGVYKLDKYFLGDMKSENAPEVADYVGPVEIRMTADGRGRGLFLTKDVVTGELLFVSNNIAVANGIENSFKDQDTFDNLMVEAVQACSFSSKALQQVYSLYDREGENGPVNVGNFRPSSGEVSDMTKKPHCAVDVTKMARIIHDTTYCPGFYVKGCELGKLRYEFFGLPSFVNHSCLPNVCKLVVGKAVFFRAAQTMAAGTELVISYISPLSDWTHYRKLRLNSFPSKCKCKRCLLEEEHEDWLKQVPADDIDAINRRQQNVVKLGRLCAEIESKMTGLSKQEKMWIRAGHIIKYLTTSFNKEFLAENGVPSDAFPSTLEVMATICAVGAGSSIAFFCLDQAIVRVEKNPLTRPLGKLVMGEAFRQVFGVQSHEVYQHLMRNGNWNLGKKAMQEFLFPAREALG